MTQNHTPTPLSIKKGLSNDLWRIVDKNGKNYAGSLSKEHAEFIVRACNAHDDLVAALELFIDMWPSMRDCSFNGESWAIAANRDNMNVVFNDARKSLAKAKAVQ